MIYTAEDAIFKADNHGGSIHCERYVIQFCSHKSTLYALTLLLKDLHFSVRSIDADPNDLTL